MYVDDLLVLTPTPSSLASIMHSLQGLYDMRVMESVDMFLGVRLTKSVRLDLLGP